MDTKKLEMRLRVLEDKEEISRLQRSYSYYLEHWQGEQIVGLFSNSPDVSVDIGKGMNVGQEGIREFFIKDQLPEGLLHLLMTLSGIVDVDPNGKTAMGRWYGFGCYAVPVDGMTRALWAVGVWENEYVKEDGKWKIKKILFNRIFTTPFEDGWVKTPMTKIEFGVPEVGSETRPSAFFKPYPSEEVLPYHYKNPVTGK